ncbi:MAG: GatB/YqeY domain-containing protein [Flavobacteriales bacterium]
MSLQKQIMDAMKIAMKAKDTVSLSALRAVKSELLLAKTSGANEELAEADEIKILQKLVKQRKESAAIFKKQNRDDLAQPELEQAAVIEKFLPEQLSEEEVTKIIDNIIEQTGATSMKDMGKVMGLTNSKIAGKADGKTISTIVKSRLS